MISSLCAKVRLQTEKEAVRIYTSGIAVNCIMLHQTNRPSLQSPLVLVLHLLLTHSCRGQSQSIGPSQPIVATVGHDVILPCQLQPAEDVSALTVEWTRSDLDSIYVHVCRAGQELMNTIHPSYRGRTSLFIDELKQGNISLKLSKVKLSDGGKYRCLIPKLNKESFVELVVALDAAASPVISLAGIDRERGGVVLRCESKGWYPKPEVIWLDGEGNLLSAETTKTVRGRDDLYTVSTRVTVEKRHSNNFTCKVQQNNINQTRETYIIVPDDFFNVQSSSSSAIIGLAVENKQAECDLLMKMLQLHEENQRREERDLQTLKENLETKTKELEEMKAAVLPIEKKQAELQRLRDENQKKETDQQSQLETDQTTPVRSSSSLWPLKWQFIDTETLQDLQRQVQTLKKEKKQEIILSGVQVKTETKTQTCTCTSIQMLNESDL
ncbi:butyrophilin-like protein 2 [Scomber scombrus]|uniref:butyrophilin-like protein 2 n=1 Tax=Scomber scombrus TaxID=13677 RepID=UPI002DD82172|nr:butyrophilin-like protein 2 [Scomber scombrus]